MSGDFINHLYNTSPPKMNLEELNELTDVLTTTARALPDITTNMEVETTSPATSSISYLGNQQLYFCLKEFFLGIQDSGAENIDPRINRPYSRKPSKVYFDKHLGKLYRGLYKTGFSLYTLYKNHTNVFVKFESMKLNQSHDVDKLCKLILNKHKTIGLSDVNTISYPDIFQYLSLVLPLDENIVFILALKHILYEAYQMSGPESEGIKDPTPSTRICLFGLALSEIFRDSLSHLIDKKMRDWEQIDAYLANKEACYEKLSLMLANSNIEISHPDRWDQVIKRKNSNVNIPYNAMWEELDPNSINDFEDTRTPKEIELLFKNTKKQYKEVMRRWTMATGGGPRDAEDYCDFESGDLEHFSRYNNQFGPILT